MSIRIVYDCRACDEKKCKHRQKEGVSENCPLKQKDDQ
jgi:hypothetical protein